LGGDAVIGGFRFLRDRHQEKANHKTKGQK
jgi:hypothetical protein